MRKDCLLLLVVLVLVFLGSCSDDPAEPENDPNAEYYVLQDGVVLVDISEDVNRGYIYWDNNHNPPYVPELRVPGTFPYFDWPAGTKILYYIPSKVYPDPTDHRNFPVLLKFKRFEARSNSLCLAADTTALVEIFKECHIHRTIPLKLPEGDHELPDDTVELIDTGNLDLTKLSVTDAKLSKLPDACAGDIEFDVWVDRGTVEVKNPVLKLDIDISNSVLHQYRSVVQSRNTIAADCSLNVRVSGRCSVSKEIFKLKPPKVFVVQAGPIPVAIAVDFSIAVGASAGGSLSANLVLDGYASDVTTWSGLEYKNDTGQPCAPEAACYDRVIGQNVHSYAANSEPVFDAHAEAYFEAYVKETVIATVYGVVGPEIWFKQYVKPEGEWAPAAEKCESDECKAYVKVVAGLDVGGALVVKFADRTFLKWKPSEAQFKPIEKTLWDDCIDIHYGGCP